jgi:hypothetical protein
MVFRVSGQVNRLFVSDGHCYIRIDDPEVVPKDGLFDLQQDHPNYNALYSLALSAAVNRYSLQIRTRGDIDPEADGYPPVSYLVVDW